MIDWRRVGKKSAGLRGAWGRLLDARRAKAVQARRCRWDRMLANAKTGQDIRLWCESVMRELTELPENVQDACTSVLNVAGYVLILASDDPENRNMDSLIRILSAVIPDPDVKKQAFDYVVDEIMESADAAQRLTLLPLYNAVKVIPGQVLQLSVLSLLAALSSCMQMKADELEDMLWRDSPETPDKEMVDKAVAETMADEASDLQKNDAAARKYASPLAIKEELDKAVVGQEDAKVAISMAVYDHMTAMANKLPGGNQNVLIIGPTGCGKTMIATLAAKLSGLPYVVVDASQISTEGFKGLNKGAILQELYSHFSSEFPAEYGIVILDEFDKILDKGFDGHGGDVSRAVQGGLLSLLDGIPVRAETPMGIVQMETKNLLIICTGAFTSLDRLQADKAKPIGFTKPGPGFASPEEKQALLREDLVSVGCLPELVGRMNQVVRIKELTPDEVFEAVSSRQGCVLARNKALLAAQNKKLMVSEPYVRRAVAASLQMKLGVRGCNNILESRLKKQSYDAWARNDDTVYLDDADTHGKGPEIPEK